jgi:hypothetical protein
VIYDAAGNVWARPRLIGFRRAPQISSHEPADSVTFHTPAPTPPAFVEEEESKPFARPYCGESDGG